MVAILMLERLMRNLNCIGIQNLPFLMKSLYLGISLDGFVQNVLPQRSVVEQFNQVDLPTLEPNIMQQQFIANFNELRANQAKRGLLISATGTGKTYAAAFTMREMNPKRILF